MLFFFYGSTSPEAMAAAEAGGPPLPSLHTPAFAPGRDATLATGAKAIAGAVLGVHGR